MYVSSNHKLVLIARMTLLAASMALVLGNPAQAADPTGTWNGTLKPPGGELRVVIHVQSAGTAGYRAQLDSPDQGASGIVIDSLTEKDGVLTFSMAQLQASYEGKWDAASKTWVGTFTQIGRAMPLTLAAGDAAVPTLSATPGAAPSTAAREALPPSLQPLELDVTRDLDHRWGEPQIAVNPKNPNNLVYFVQGDHYTYACQQMPTPECAPKKASTAPTAPELPVGMTTVHHWLLSTLYVSFDRGKSWKTVQPPLEIAGAPKLSESTRNGANINVGDPIVRAAADGTFWITYEPGHVTDLSNPIAARGNFACPVLSKSTDGGLTWSMPHCTGTPADRESFDVDETTGTVYVASTGMLGPMGSGDPDAPLGQIVDRWLTSTKDAGVTFTVPQPMGGDDGGQHIPGGGVTVANHGLLATAFGVRDAARCAFFVGGGAPCIVFQTTTDAGKTWRRARVPLAPEAAPGVVMVTSDKRKPGHFAVAIADSAGHRFLVYRTTDAGGSWKGPAIITLDPSRTPMKAAIATSAKGVIGVMWQSRSQTGAYSVWATIFDDAAAAFAAPLQVSTAESPPGKRDVANGVNDDVSDIALNDTEVYVAWADLRPGERAGYLGVVKLAAFRHK